MGTAVGTVLLFLYPVLNLRSRFGVMASAMAMPMKPSHMRFAKGLELLLAEGAAAGSMGLAASALLGSGAGEISALAGGSPGCASLLAGSCPDGDASNCRTGNDSASGAC